MSTEDLFKEASILVQNLDKTPDNSELLKLYGLYKQAKVGDYKEQNTNFFDVKGRMKSEHWEKQKGKTKEEAMKEYTEFVVELMQKYNS
tara:strand:- start:180 stop:446 length:267 start_codon:yes stop_codon:yes gene_type:complete